MGLGDKGPGTGSEADELKRKEQGSRWSEGQFIRMRVVDNKLRQLRPIDGH